MACGYEPTKSERRKQGLEFDGSDLKEVTRESKTEVQTKSAEELMISALYSSGRSGRTWKQAVGLFKSLCTKHGENYRVPKTVTVGGHRYQMLPFGSPDGGRRVSSLYPFVNGKAQHGGEYEVRESLHEENVF